MKINLNEKTNLIRLIIGAVLLIAGIILKNFLYNFNSAFLIFIAAYVILGADIIYHAFRNLLRGKVFDENFLMSIATAGAFLIGEAPEAVTVMLFFQIGEYFQEKAAANSKKSITKLMDIRPDYANIESSERILKVDPATVNPGDIIIVKPGEKIPLDGIVINGVSMIDTSALTGESIPRKADEGSAVLSGCVNMSGKLKIKVTKTFGESTVSKIIDLVENSSGKKAKTEKFITKFARIYTPVVVITAFFLAVIPPLLFGAEWKVWIHRALVFLVISCPCALVLSIPMGFFAGIGRAAKNGILVKGGNYLEAFNQLKTIVFDKTGTLTAGVFKVTEIQNAAGFGKNELIELAANAESFSNHPIALSVMRHCGKDINKEALSEYTEIAGCGVSVKLNDKLILAGNKNLLEKNGIKINESSGIGTKVYIAFDGTFAGCIVISDEIKPGSKDAVTALRNKGIEKIIMLTGDTPQTAKEIADELELDEYYASLLSHDKAAMMEKIKADVNKKSAQKIAFVGDGINDAPVLAMSDIGIAMGALGSDAAIEAADVVLMTDEISKISAAIDISRLTKKIVSQNIVFSLSVKIIFLALGAFGFANMWEAVFADVGVSLLAVLNSMRIMKAK